MRAFGSKPDPPLYRHVRRRLLYGFPIDPQPPIAFMIYDLSGYVWLLPAHRQLLLLLQFQPGKEHLYDIKGPFSARPFLMTGAVPRWVGALLD